MPNISIILADQMIGDGVVDQRFVTLKQSQLAPLTHHFQQHVGDAFNLGNLAKLFAAIEMQNDMTPQMTEATQYTRLMPLKNNFAATKDTKQALARKRGVGLGRRHSGTGGDIPEAEVIYDHVELGTLLGAISYQYSIHELAVASTQGVSIDTDRYDAAVLSYEKHMNNVALLGEESSGTKGLFNQVGISVVIGAHVWVNAAPQEILADFNGALNVDASEFEDAIAPNTVLMASELMAILSQRLMPDNSGKTILQFIKENNLNALNGKPLTIEATRKLNSAGTGGSHRIIAYCKDPACIEMRIPQEVQFLAAQVKNFDLFFPGHYLYQGVWLKRIDSMRYLDVPKT